MIALGSVLLFVVIFSLLLVGADINFTFAGWGTCLECRKRDACYQAPDGGPGGYCRECWPQIHKDELSV